MNWTNLIRNTMVVAALAGASVAMADRGRGGSGGGGGGSSGGGNGGGGGVVVPSVTPGRTAALAAVNAVNAAMNAGIRLIKDQADIDENALNAMRLSGANQATLTAYLNDALARITPKYTQAQNLVNTAAATGSTNVSAAGGSAADAALVTTAQTNALNALTIWKAFYENKLRRHAVAIPPAPAPGTPVVDDNGGRRTDPNHR